MQSEVQGAEATVDDHLRNLIQLMKRGGRISVTDIPNDPTFLSSNFGGPTVQAMAEKLEAALSAAEPQPAPSVAVKALEWNDDPCPAAKCAFGHYVINENYSLVELFVGYGRASITGLGRIQLDHGATADDLKAAAQADYEARIRSALSAQVQDVAQWQPIETAPKDGTPVILWTVWLGDEISPDPFSEVQIGYWDHGNGLPESHDFSRRPEWVVQRIGEPTHWMPLPAAPAKQEG